MGSFRQAHGGNHAPCSFRRRDSRGNNLSCGHPGGCAELAAAAAASTTYDVAPAAAAPTTYDVAPAAAAPTTHDVAPAAPCVAGPSWVAAVAELRPAGVLRTAAADLSGVGNDSRLVPGTEWSLLGRHGRVLTLAAVTRSERISTQLQQSPFPRGLGAVSLYIV